MTRLLPLVLLLAILASPSPTRAAQAFAPAAQESAGGEARAALEQGLELYRAGQFDAALPLLRDFVQRYPNDPDVPRACLPLARMLLRAGQPQEALRYLQGLAAPQLTTGLHLALGQALVADGQAQAGREALLAIDPAQLSAAERTERLQALARAAEALGRSLEALTFVQRALALAPEKSAPLLEEGHRLLQTLDDASLDEAAFMLQETTLGLDATVQRAQRVALRGDKTTALRLLAPVLANNAEFPGRRDATDLYARLTGKPWLQRAIGVLLPLSGKYAAFGQLVKRGMELALETGAGTSSPVRLLFRDVGADPQQSGETVSGLVHDDGVMAIAGPITSAAAESAALRAQQEGVPLLTLSQREGLPELGAMVFRDALTPRLQAETLARYAVEKRGLTNFAILAPDTRPGQEMADQFAAALRDCGGAVLARAAYPPEATDFRRQIRLLMGKDPDARDPEPSSDPLEDLFVPDPPPLPFQALFIPDYADKVGLIAPQLPYYGLDGLPLFGINGWNSSELVRTAGSYVEGAVFVDGFFVHSPHPLVRDFVDRYVAHYGEEPTILEAQGFDVAGILLGILRDPAIASREDVRRGLQRLHDYPGVTGTTSFSPEGEAERPLFLLQVQHGQIVQIN